MTFKLKENKKEKITYWFCTSLKEKKDMTYTSILTIATTGQLNLPNGALPKLSYQTIFEPGY